jgi:tetratricopeptide (TPR) repeat protein
MDHKTRALYNDALALYDKGKIKEAMEGFKKVLHLYPGYPDVLNALGLAYSLIGNLDEAINCFKKATEINPEYIEAYVNMAITYNEQCQFDAAIKVFEQAASLETKEKGFSPQLRIKLANTYAQLGDTYSELQDYPRAQVEYEKAVEISPSFLDIRLKLAKTYYQLSDYPKSEKVLMGILDRNKNYLEAKIMLGQCYYQQHNYEDASREWEEALRIEPMNIKARSYLNMLKERRAKNDQKTD